MAQPVAATRVCVAGVENLAKRKKGFGRESRRTSTDNSTGNEQGLDQPNPEARCLSSVRTDCLQAAIGSQHCSNRKPEPGSRPFDRSARA
jgi:hypothetical protein